jgi:hypothetical protein
VRCVCGTRGPHAGDALAAITAWNFLNGRNVEMEAKAAAWNAHREMHEDGGDLVDLADMDAKLDEERAARGLQ